MSLKRSVAAVIAQNVFSFLVGFANSVLSTRVLGPEGKGVFAIYTSSVELFALLLGIGVPHALLYYAAKDVFSRKQVFNTALLFLFMGTGLFLLIVKGSFGLGVSEFFLPEPFNGSTYQFTLVGYFFCLSGWYLFVSILNGHKLFVESNIVSIVSIGLTFVMYAVAFYQFTADNAFYDVTTFYWFQLASAAGVLLLCFYYYYRKIARAESITSSFLSIPQTRSVLGYGFLYFISNLMIFFNAKIDYWFVNYLAGPEELGIYVLASNVGLLMILLPNAIGLVLSSYQAGSENGVSEQTARICRISFSGGLIFSIVLWVFGGMIIRFLYGSDFERAAPVLNVLLVGVVPYCVFTVLRGYFAGAGNLKVLIMATLFGLILTLTLDLLLIKPFGIMGAAVASMLAYLASTAYLLRSFCKQSGMPVSRLLFVTRQDVRDVVQTIYSRSR